VIEAATLLSSLVIITLRTGHMVLRKPFSFLFFVKSFDRARASYNFRLQLLGYNIETESGIPKNLKEINKQKQANKIKSSTAYR